MDQPVQRVEHADDFHGTAASRDVRESNDVAEEDRDDVILLGLDLAVLDLDISMFGLDLALPVLDVEQLAFNRSNDPLIDFVFFGLDLAVLDLDL